MNVTFETVEELYKRLMPALRAKKQEMKRSGYPYIKEEDIWNYLKEVKWLRSKDLSLSDMVNDVFNTDNTVIDRYLREKLNLNTRSVYFND